MNPYPKIRSSTAVHRVVICLLLDLTYRSGFNNTGMSQKYVQRKVFFPLFLLSHSFIHFHTSPIINISYTRWFKYDRDYLCVNKSQFVPVIFEPPCIYFTRSHYVFIVACTRSATKVKLFSQLYCLLNFSTQAALTLEAVVKKT
jgi:hypothetical protein